MNIIYNHLILAKSYFFNTIERIAKKKQWILYTTLITTIISLLLAFPRREIIVNDYSKISEVEAVKKQIEAPFKKYEYSKGSHNSKLSFRLTVPIIAHYLKLSFEKCKLLEIICGILLFSLTAMITYKLTNDKISSIMTSFLAGSIFAGSTAFIGFRGMFDGLAIFFLTLSLFAKKPFLIGFFIFIASWIDERALIASSLIVIYNLIPDDKDKLCDIKNIFNNMLSIKIIVCIITWSLYFSIRYYLAKYNGFTTDTGGTNLFLSQINNLPAGIWTALEGAWILIVLSFLYLILNKNYFFLILYAIPLFIIIFVSMSVFDITRSMAYMFPVIFIALKLIAKSESKENIRLYLFSALLISLIWPSYYIGGKEYIWWHSPPLPIQLVRSFILNK